MKWKCHNCQNTFESEKGCEKDEFLDHVVGCFEVLDFFELEKTKANTEVKNVSNN